MVKAAKQTAIKAKNKELKSRGKPRRPLSSYNMFFAIQRKKILREQHLNTQDGKNDGHANVGFANLANIVAQRWKNVDPYFKADLEAKARQEKIRYKNEMQDWELKLKMQSDLEAIEREVKMSNEVGDALTKIEATKKELEQMKPSSSETELCEAEVCEKEDAVADDKSTTNEDSELGFQNGFESPAADINEAIAFLKETFETPNSPNESIADRRYTPVHIRNVSAASAFSVNDVCPVVNTTTTSSYMGNSDYATESPSPVQYCSPYDVPKFSMASKYPQSSPAFGRRRSISTIRGEAPFTTGMRISGNLMGQYNPCCFSGFDGLQYNNNEVPSQWPPLQDLQRFFGIDPHSHGNAATARSRHNSCMY